MSDAPIRFGLLGYGAFGKFHAQAMTAVDGVELAAIAEVSDAGFTAAQADYPDGKVYRDYDELLANESLDVVDIVLPNHLHFDAARSALEQGNHLLLEKPMTLNVADCQSLLQLASANDLTIAVGHEFRLSSLWGKVKSLIDDGEVGDPKYVLVELSRHPYLQGSDGWRYDIERVGNWILEEPIHFFDLARWYLSAAGEPQSVYALASSRQADHPELQDNLSALIQHAGGAYAVVTQTLSAFEHHQTVKVTGSKGAIWASWGGTMGRSLDPEFQLKSFDGENVREIPIEKTPGEPYELRTQIEQMAHAARGDACNLATGDDGMWAVALCEAADVSVKERREVDLNVLVGS